MGQVVNLGSDEEVTILQLAEQVKQKVKSKSEIRFVPFEEAFRPGFEDMQRRVPDLKKAKRLIGFEPTRKLDEVIGDILAAES
jgi:UDP-glucose 4-epimerase